MTQLEEKKRLLQELKSAKPKSRRDQLKQKKEIQYLAAEIANLEQFQKLQIPEHTLNHLFNWDSICSDNLTSAQELGQDFPSQQPKSEDLNSLDSTRQTSGVEKFSESAIPTQQYGEMLKMPQLENTTQTLSQPLLHANPSQFKGSDKEQMTKETVSQQYSERSPSINQDISVLKMYPDSLPQDYDPEKTDSIWLQCLDSLPPAGTIRNGSLSAQDTLGQPSLEKDYCWLDSPGGLSSGKSRPPGQSRLESKLRKYGLLQKGEVINPAFLERGLGLPPNYLDPSERRTAAQLLEDKERQLEIVSILEWQPLPSNESSISKVLGVTNNNDITPSTQKRRKKGEGTGRLFSKILIKPSGKKYEQWWYQWEAGGKKRTKYVPKKVLGVIHELEIKKTPVEKILKVLGVSGMA